MAISRANMDLFSFALIYIVSVCLLLRFLARHEGPVQVTQPLVWDLLLAVA